MSKKFNTVSMADLLESAPPTTAKATKATPIKAVKKAVGPVAQQQLVMQLPADTIKALKMKAAEENSTVRAVVLAALKDAGFPVPAGQAVDLRKVKA